MSGMNLGDSVQPEIGFVDVEGKGDKDINYELKLATPLLLLSKVRKKLRLELQYTCRLLRTPWHTLRSCTRQQNACSIWLVRR